jgi:hypothetical protein
MIYKIQDWVIENEGKLDWGIIFTQCNKYNLVEKYWHYFVNYFLHHDNSANNNTSLLRFESIIEYMSENINSLQIISILPTIYWKKLSLNPAAIRLIEQNLDKADWSRLSKNSAAIPLLEKHFDNIDWTMLSENPNADKLLVSNMNYVNMYHLCLYNPNVVNIVNIMLEKDPEVIHSVCWYSLSMNSNAVPLLEKYPEKINWGVIVRNRNAFHLLKKYNHLINDLGWEMLNRNPYATKFLEQFPHKVRPYPSFMDLPDVDTIEIDEDEEDSDHIDWYCLSMNPSIYVYDYKQMKINMDILREELMQKALHPSRVIKWIELGYDDMLE